MDPVLGIFLGSVVTALGAWIIQLRRLSGDIGTSEAEQLWKESTSIRETYARRMSDLEKRVADLERDKNELLKVNLDLREHNMTLERELATLTERCEGISKENVHLKKLLTDKLGDS